MTSIDEIEARVRRFTPTGLTEAEWALAREAVVDVVVGAEPASLEQAKLLASRLCSYLSWLPKADWDRRTAPDLQKVLSSGRVERFTSREGMPTAKQSSREAYRTKLNRLVAVASGVGRLREGRRVAAPAAAGAFWPAVANAEPFPVLAASYVATGGSLHGTVWAGLIDDLLMDLSRVPVLRRGPDDRDPRANAATAVCGTVRSVQAAAAQLRSAQAPVLGVVPASTTNTYEESAKTAKPLSRAAAIRVAKAAQAARAARASVGHVADIADLGEELAGMLVGWVPQDLSRDRWVLVEGAVAAAVAAYSPPSQGSLRNVRSILVPFAAWLQQRPRREGSGPLDIAEFLTDGVIEAYLAGPRAGEPDASRATVRSVLRRVVRNLDPGPKAEPIAYQPVQGPYTAIECLRFVTLARNQPTIPLRRSLSAMVALGLGAGLGAEDQRTIAPCHIREVDLGEHGPALAVDVPGPRARTVIVRSEYEALLREAMDAHAKARRGKSTPLYGVKPDRKNGANRVAARAVTATGIGIDIDAARLRATWLVACMSASVPLGALLHAAGLRTPRTLADLLVYCPPADPEAVAAVLRSMGREVTS